MAKLNGVTTVSEQISYNGVNYAKSDMSAHVSDIIRFDDSSSYVKTGEFYEIVRVDSSYDPQIIDEDGDEYDLCSDDFTVFKRVEEAAQEPAEDVIVHEGVKFRKVARRANVGDLVKVIANTNRHELSIGNVVKITRGPYSASSDSMATDGPSTWMKQADYRVLEPLVTEAATAVTTPLSNTLPSSYVIHDGKVYVKEARKANVGELIIFVQDYLGHVDAEITEVTGLSEGDMVYGKKRGPNTVMLPKRYNVLVPTDTVTIGDVEYTLEKRKASKGERILVIDASCTKGKYDNRSILTSKGDYVEDYSTGAEEISFGLFYREYLVLVPKIAAQSAPQYHEVDRAAKVGERIRIVKTKTTDRGFSVGDEFTVNRVDSDGSDDVRVTLDKDNRKLVVRSEYVVLEPVYIEVKRKANVGERIRIVDANAPLGSYKNGDEFIVTEVSSLSSGKGYVRTGNNDTLKFHYEYVVLEPAAAKYEPQPGDKVRQTYSPQRTLTLEKRRPTSDSSAGKAWNTVEGEWIRENQFDVIERAADIKKPEDTRLKVGEYAKVTEGDNGYSNVGDIVKISKDDGSTCPFETEHIDGKYAGWKYVKHLTRATDAEVAEAQRKAAREQFSVGDTVKLASGGGEWPLYGFVNGETYVIHDMNPQHSKSGAFRIREIGKSGGGGYATPEQLVKVTTPTETKTEFSVGDFARVVGNERSHGADIGDIVKIMRDDNSSLPFKCTYADGKEIYGGEWFTPSELVKLTPAEVEQARKEAEEKAQQAALKAKWAAIGRKVGEFKTGDIVCFNQSTGAEKFPKGTVITLERVNGNSIKFGPDGKFGGSTSWLDLIAPVESLFNAAK